MQVRSMGPISEMDMVIIIPVWFRNRLISAGLEPVTSHIEIITRTTKFMSSAKKHV